MNTPRTLRALLLLALGTIAAAGYSATEHTADSNGSEHHDAHEDNTTHTEIGAATAIQAGIRSTAAGPGTIERHIQVYGRLVTPPGQTARISARFPGVITAINVNVGDDVNKGDVLARIESNESLKEYSLKAPFAAVVQNRMASVGEMTGSEPLLTLADNRQLWAELKVFPGQRFEVSTEQSVHISHNNDTHEGTISSVIPATQQQPFVVACVVLENSENEMTPGELVSAQIDAELVRVPLIVESSAIQEMEGKPTVFVQIDDTFEVRHLKIGRSDGKHTEVLEGLEPGDDYVVENSYLIKADLLKSGAAHSH